MDNEVFRPGLMADWGLSIYVEAGWGPKVLMDTGGSFRKLVGNSEALGVELGALDAIFISHWHGDHCGALADVLNAIGGEVEVIVPRRPGWSMSRALARAGASVVEAGRPLEFLPGFYSTGDLGGEHSLVVEVEGLGLIILTGCSHPGPAKIVSKAVEVFGGPAHALVGGLHISSYREGLELGAFLSRAGLRLLCPCHCTGPMAKRGLQEAFKGEFRTCGSGRELEFGPGRGGG